MTNLPITSITPQSPGNATKAAQTNSMADSQAVKGSLPGCINPAQPPAGTGSPASGAPLADAAEPFAAMLARQIGETDPSSSNVVSGAITTDGTATFPKDDRDKPAITASTANDQAGTLAAILLQLPQQMRAPVANDAASTSTATNMMAGIDASARRPPSRIDAKLGMAITAPDKADAESVTTDRQPLADAIGRDAVKRMELATGLAQPNPNTTPLAASPAVSAKHMELANGLNQPDSNTTPLAASSAVSAKHMELANGLNQPDSNTTPLAASSTVSAKHMELANGLNQPNPNTTPLAASPAATVMMPNMLANNRVADTTQSIATPLGNNGWADDFSQKISWMSTQKNHVAELQLNPPDLGPLNVVLKVSDNQATALFTSPHSTVREAVENALPKLREILADNGIMLGNTTVSDHFPRDRNTDGFMHQGSGSAAQRGNFSGAPESAVAPPATAQIMPARRHNGMVDTFA